MPFLPPAGSAGSLVLPSRSMTGFRRRPRRSISTSTTSPARRKRGGFCAAPIPPGVPVAMMSPGSSVITALSSLTSAATVKTMLAVLDDWTVTPFRRVSMRRSCGSGTFLGGDQERTDRGETVEALPERPLARPVLHVARAHVVNGQVAAHVRQGLVLRHVPGLAPDHDAELALVVDRAAQRRQHDRVVRPGQGRRELREDRRPGGQVLAGLGRVIAVVQPDADDLGRPGHRREQADPVRAGGAPTRGRPRRGRPAGPRARPRTVSQGRQAGAGPRPSESIDGVRPGQNAQVGRAVRVKPTEPHRLPPFQSRTINDDF